MNTTESNIICTGCDAPFLPTKTDMCARCEQRQSDKLDGLAAGAGICISVVGLVIALMAAAASCHGADSIALTDGALQIFTGRIHSDLHHGWKKQQFPPKPAEGKARQHEVIHTNQTKQLTVYGFITGGAPANHSAGASVVDDALLNRVAWAESRNNPRAIGKLGEIGIFQLRPIAIREVNRVFGMCFRIQDARDPVKSREIAKLYLRICESRCRVKTPANVYAKYRGVK